MNNGGFTETIWHFAGYLHIADTTLSVDVPLYGDPAALRPDDDPAVFVDPLRKPQFDDLESLRIRFPESTPTDPQSHISKANLPSYTPPRLTEVPQPHYYPQLTPNPEPDILQQGLLIRSHPVITVEYQPGGTETLLSVHQFNHTDDRDLLTSDAIRYQNGEVVVPPELNVEPIFHQMLQEARDATPDSMPFDAVGRTETLISAISARDQYWSEHGHPPGEDSTSAAPVGRIVDGQVSNEPLHEPTITEIAPWRPEVAPVVQELTGTVTAVGPTQGVGTVAETGLNTQINQAAILDVNEATGSLMIGGNYYFSRGIVQVNVLTDNDHVDIATDNLGLPSVATHGNEVHNIAEFVNHDITASYHGAAATPLWSVDVLQGNFYDIKSIVQYNNMNDSDRTVQATEGTYYEAKTGLNDQINVAKVTNLDAYDIIIVGGDYHRADWIFQYNIVLDSDIAKLFYTNTNADSSIDVTTGFNQLTNQASITTYDSAAFKTMNAAQHDLLDRLSNQEIILNPNADWQLAGNATGTLKVLYVTGDYYDVNVISQINMLVDVDQSIMASATAGSRQGIASGGNIAINDAQIIDPGTLSTSKYLGGTAYEDSILIQTNLITDSDTVKIHDTSTLVPELVAFAHEAELTPTTDNPLFKPLDTAHHDLLM